MDQTATQPDLSNTPNVMRFGSDAVVAPTNQTNAPNSAYSVFQNYYSTNPSSTAATSDPFRSAVTDVGKNITNEANKPSPLAVNNTGQPGSGMPGTVDNTQLNTDYAASQAENKRQQDALAAQRDAEVKNINSEFDTQESSLKTTQAGQEGQYGNTLARIGGYLGSGTAGEGAMIKLQNTHQQQITALEGKRQAAIGQAQNAYNSKQFALAHQLVQEAKDYHDQILAANKQHSVDVNNYLNQQYKQQSLDLKGAAESDKANKANVDYARKLGVNKPFYSTDGQTLIDSQTGEKVDMNQYQQKGGKGDGSDIQMVDQTPIKFETKNILGQDGTTHSIHIGYNSAGQPVSQTDLGPSKDAGAPKTIKNGKQTMQWDAKSGKYVPIAGGGNPPTNNDSLATAHGYDPKELGQVQKIIKANPGEYGNSWDGIVKLFKGDTEKAQKYDAVLKSHYNVNDDAKHALDAWSGNPDEQNLENYNALKQQYLQLHQFDQAAASKAFNAAIKKPRR